MAALIDVFEQQYATLSAEITAKTSSLSTLSAEEAPNTVSEIVKQIEEVSELLEQMDLEVKSMAMEQRSKYGTRVKSYQTELQRLKADFNKSKQACEEKWSRGDLFSSTPLDDGYYAFDDQKQRLLESSERSSRLLHGGRQLTVETEQIGAAVLSDLAAQRETITRATQRLRSTDSELGQSSRVLGNMLRRAMQGRFVAYAALAFVAFTLLISIFLAIRSHF